MLELCTLAAGKSEFHAGEGLEWHIGIQNLNEFEGENV